MVGGRGEAHIAAETWPRPVPEITPDMALAGFHHVTAVASDNDRATLADGQDGCAMPGGKFVR